MRLTINEINSIKKNIFLFDEDAKIYLFGSRTFDNKKGGDIDILLVSQKISNDNLRDIKIKIFDEIGEQKIDICLKKNIDTPFSKTVVKEGILL